MLKAIDKEFLDEVVGKLRIVVRRRKLQAKKINDTIQPVVIQVLVSKAEFREATGRAHIRDSFIQSCVVYLSKKQGLGGWQHANGGLNIQIQDQVLHRSHYTLTELSATAK